MTVEILRMVFANLASLATAVSIPLCLCFILTGAQQLRSYRALPSVTPNEQEAAVLRHQQLTRAANGLAVATIGVTTAGIVLGLFSSVFVATGISVLVSLIGACFSRYYRNCEQN